MQTRHSRPWARIPISPCPLCGLNRGFLLKHWKFDRKINSVDNTPLQQHRRPKFVGGFFEDVALRSLLPDRPSRGNGARTELDYRFCQASWGVNLSAAARQSPCFLRAAVAVSSTTCFRAFQPAKIIGFYRPRFFRTEAHAMSPPQPAPTRRTIRRAAIT